MGIVHLSSDELSALLDGELAPTAELRAREHLAECASCSAEYSFSIRLDAELREPPALSCDAVLELLSASHDRQADDAEQQRGCSSLPYAKRNSYTRQTTPPTSSIFPAPPTRRGSPPRTTSKRGSRSAGSPRLSRSTRPPTRSSSSMRRRNE